MHKLTRQQSNLQLLPAEKFSNVDDMTTKLAGIGCAWATGPAVLNRQSILEILMYFTLLFIL